MSAEDVRRMGAYADGPPAWREAQVQRWLEACFSSWQVAKTGKSQLGIDVPEGVRRSEEWQANLHLPDCIAGGSIKHPTLAVDTKTAALTKFKGWVIKQQDYDMLAEQVAGGARGYFALCTQRLTSSDDYTTDPLVTLVPFEEAIDLGVHTYLGWERDTYGWLLRAVDLAWPRWMRLDIPTFQQAKQARGEFLNATPMPPYLRAELAFGLDFEEVFGLGNPKPPLDW